MTSSDESGPNVGGILANLWALIEAVVDDSEQALEALGLSPKAFFVLETVGDCPFPAELARRMHLPPPTVTYLVKQLEAKGFLERRAEPGDLRKFRLVQTALGSDALCRGREALSRPLGERLVRLSPEEVASFDRLIRQLAGRKGRDDLG